MSDLVANELHRKAKAYRDAGDNALADRVDARIAAAKKPAKAVKNAPPDEPVEATDELEDHTKSELLDIAADQGVEVKPSMKKADIVEAISEPKKKA